MLYLVSILFLLVTAGVAVVAFENIANDVPMVFFGQTISLSVGLLILFSYFLGALLLYLIAFGAAERDRRELQRLKARVTELEQATLRVPSDRLQPIAPTQPAAPIVPMPGMPMPGSDISDMPTQH